jgi:hypothetical protein
MRPLLVVLAATFALLPRPTAAAAMSLGQWLAAAGNPTVPAAWAGVWDFNDDDYDCVTNDLLSSDSSADTLCTNAEIFGDSSSGWICSGTTSDTSLEVTCSYTEEIDTGCTVTIENTLSATRTGETLVATATSSQTFTPTGCAFIPDNCIRTETTGTRIGPEPPNCTTAVGPSTWGRTKAQYR